MDKGYPRDIEDDFPGIGHQVDAAYQKNGMFSLLPYVTSSACPPERKVVYSQNNGMALSSFWGNKPKPHTSKQVLLHSERFLRPHAKDKSVSPPCDGRAATLAGCI